MSVRSRAAPVDRPLLRIDYRRLLEGLPAGAYMCDADGLITYYNEHAVRVWGRAPRLNDPADRFCGSFRLFAVDGTPLTHAQCWMARALKEKREFNGCEIVVERPDGSRVIALAHASPILDEAGELLGAMNVLVDITEQKRTQEMLRSVKDELAARVSDLRRLHETSLRLSSTLELRTVLEETLLAVLAIEQADRGLLWLCGHDAPGQRLAASVGFDEDFLKLCEHPFHGGGACSACYEQQRRVIVEDTQTDPLFAEYREIAARAGFRAVHSTPLITRAGRIVGVVSAHFREPHRPDDRTLHLIDLGIRQAVDYIENARLFADVQEADRRKDEFLATLAHELRNPLAPLRNSLHILRLSGELTPAGERIHEMMERQVNCLVRLVDDLLEVSRISRGRIELRKEHTSVAAVIRQAVETSRPLIDAADHQLAIGLPTGMLTVHGDLVRLAQVVSNLLNNAARYTEPGGQIWLNVRRDGNEVAISVRDTGKGIAPDLLPRVFDMFLQVDPAFSQGHGGLGIGLTLVKRLTDMHGGTVEARSAGQGKGSEFIVRLPLVDAPRRELADGIPNAGAATPLEQRRILVVDDNRDVADSLALLLRCLGAETQVAYAGQQALEMLESFAPTTVLLDLGMPGFDGFSVARLIRQKAGGRNIRLIALTGWGQETDRQRTAEAGFDHHLVKPVDPDALEALLTAGEPDRTYGMAE